MMYPGWFSGRTCSSLLHPLLPLRSTPIYATSGTDCDRRRAYCLSAIGSRSKDIDYVEGSVCLDGVSFRPEVLDRVRILLADPLPMPEPPFASVMRRCGFDFPSPSFTEAITFEDVIACREGMNASLLFHELVHVVQYHVLGVREFARQYVSGFLDTSHILRSLWSGPHSICNLGSRLTRNSSMLSSKSVGICDVLRSLVGKCAQTLKSPEARNGAREPTTRDKTNKTRSQLVASPDRK
jgi:hypothetical protein